MARLSIITELLGGEAVEQGLAQIAKGIVQVGEVSGKGGAGGGAAGAIEDLTQGFLGFAEGVATGVAGIVAAALSIQHLTEFVKESVLEYANLERVSLRLDAVFQASGASARVNEGAIRELASTLAQTTFVTQSQVLSAAASLATFGSIGQENFEKVLKSSADLATVMNTDFQSAVIQLGRGMDGLANGSVQGLYRIFRLLSPAVRENITDLAKMGDTMGAQKALIDAIQSSFGGAAEGEHAGLAGAIDRTNKAWEDFSTAVGGWVDSHLHLPEFFNMMAEAINKTGDAMNAASGQRPGGAFSSDQLDALGRQLTDLEHQRDVTAGQLATSAMPQDQKDAILKNIDDQTAHLHQLIETLEKAAQAEKNLHAEALAAAQASSHAIEDFNKQQADQEEAIGKAVDTATSRMGKAKQQLDSVVNAANLVIKNPTGGVTPEEIADAKKAIVEAKQAYNDEAEAVAADARAHAGYSLKVQEQIVDIQNLTAAQEVSRHAAAVETLAQQYLNEERNKGKTITAAMIVQMHEEAEAVVKVNEAQAKASINRDINEQIAQTQRLTDAQKQSAYQYTLTSKAIEIEKQMESQGLDADKNATLQTQALTKAKEQLAADEKSIAQQEAVDHQQQVSDLQREISAVNANEVEREALNIQLQKEADGRAKLGYLTPELIAQYQKESTEIAQLTHNLDQMSQAHQADVQGTQQEIQFVQSSLEELSDSMTQALEHPKKAGQIFKQLLVDIGTQLAKLIMQLGVINPLMNSMFKDVEGYNQQPTASGLFGLLGIGGSAAGSGKGDFSFLSSSVTGGTAPGTLGYVPGFAAGGDFMVNRPTLIQVGEAGEERVTITPTSQVGRGRGGMMGAHVSIYAPNSDKAGLKRIERMLKQMDASFDSRATGAVINRKQRGGRLGRALSTR